MRKPAWAVAASLASLSATAENVDIGAALAAKLNAKAAEIFQAKHGKPLPAGTTATASFQGSITQSGIAFSVPPAIPQKSSVLMQTTVANCDGSQPTQRVAFKQATAQSESWRPTDTASAPVPVKATFSTPPGTAFDPATGGYAREWNAGGEVSQPLAWDASYDAQVVSGRKVNVQFVVDEQTVEAPFRVTFVASGKSTLTYDKPAQGLNPGISWVAQQPASPVPGGVSVRDDYNGMTGLSNWIYTYQYICRGRVGNAWHAGRVEGDSCAVTAPGVGLKNVKPFEWLSADWGTLQPTCQTLVGFSPGNAKPGPYQRCSPPNNPTWDRAFEWVAGNAANPLRAGDSSVVCRINTAKDTWVLGATSGSACITPTGFPAQSSFTYQTINIRGFTPAERNVVEVNVEDHLPETDRIFALRGLYTGTTAVQGDFRTGTPRVPTCETAKVKSVGAATSGAKVPAAAGATPAKAPAETLSAEELRKTAALPKSAAVSRTAVKPTPAAPAKRS